jgi:predicted negative regulator of RcsB-dependent stress response
VDELLSEKEQIEKIRQWWRENGWFLIGGAALSALAYYGWNQYGAYRDGQAELASGVYLQLQAAVEDDSANVETLLTQLRNDYGSSPYADQAALLMARYYLIRDSARAAAELRQVMESSDDAELAMVARLRLARVEAYRENYDTALAVLNVATPGQFAARIAEIKGDIHVALGQTDDARAAYIQALTGAGSDTLDRSYIQMKLNDLSTPRVSEVPTEGDA